MYCRCSSQELQYDGNVQKAFSTINNSDDMPFRQTANLKYHELASGKAQEHGEQYGFEEVERPAWTSMNSKSHVNRKTDLPTRNRTSAHDKDNIHNSSNAITIAQQGRAWFFE